MTLRDSTWRVSPLSATTLAARRRKRIQGFQHGGRLDAEVEKPLTRNQSRWSPNSAPRETAANG